MHLFSLYITKKFCEKILKYLSDKKEKVTFRDESQDKNFLQSHQNCLKCQSKLFILAHFYLIISKMSKNILIHGQVVGYAVSTLFL